METKKISQASLVKPDYYYYDLFTNKKVFCYEKKKIKAIKPVLPY